MANDDPKDNAERPKPAGAPPELSGALLVAVMRASPYREVSLEPGGLRLPVRAPERL